MKRITQVMAVYLAAMLQISTAGANEDIEQIKQVIQWYFDGTAEGKPALVEQAFLPSLELQFVDSGGAFRRWSGQTYISGIEEGKKNSRVGEIIAIDVTGDSAMAKATITIHNTVYTDYFLLLKLSQGWKITNKIFTRKQVRSHQYSK
ncbi:MULTISPECIES: nuclear transport factor 2 family protein [Pseudoalteromonas]|uniref:Nuclear transport factor 2 family protein n=1 Tax=Pseudoalteromonas obscura TaxID=3048491 RepID=A0ABT7EFC7_9GAMM|nr:MULTISPECIES: nuclear transport factor 2 family protein [Pseudoalteromonas]MBQ4835755.1 nuclear transport factor 2 family protein [Pseudoalteromonas luteoviolacea]MDK2593994.1 nuclear transport factor 2 family protein [Pseudoalteromonas sp. P94(2023)]